MSRARGQIPFWQRVGNAPNISKAHRFLAHLADTATLGGAGPDVLRRVGAGTLAAYPSDLLFQYLQDDTGDAASTFQQAFGKSLVLGGSSAALGGMFLGTKEKHRQLAIGDERNFRSDLTKFGTADQIALYDSIPVGFRRSIATYAAANPNLNWNFTVKGNSAFDTASNTVTVNIASPEPLKALVAHEINHALVIKNQMEDGVAAMLIGDGQRGGLIRSADGTLDKNFQAWVDAYNTRLKAQGLNPIPLKQAAVEYFVEAAADRVAGMAESGQLGAIAGRTNARRLINRAVDAMLPKIPVLRDLHFKMGGLMETNGNMVAGNGLLAEGLRELPQTKKLVNQMLNRSAGRSDGRFDALGAQIVRKDVDSGGATLPVQKGDKALLDSFVSLFETEEVNGTTRVKYDRAGDPIPVSQATDHARSQLGTLVGEITDQQRRDGKVFADGELRREKDGGFVGTHLGADTIKAIEERGVLNKEQIRMLKTLNKSVKDFDGSRFSMVYHPAIKKIGKKIRYGSLSPTLRDVVPYQVEVTKAGNLIFRLMSVTQLEENIRVQSQSRKGKELYSGNTDAIKQDLTVVMETHRKGDTTDAYFKEKYGPVKGPEYKNFINGIFGLMASEQKGKNPNFATGDFAKNQVVRSYRLDRISQAVKMTGDTAIPMPFMYDSVKLNLFPNGVPDVDGAGRISGMETNKSDQTTNNNGPGIATEAGNQELTTLADIIANGGKKADGSWFVNYFENEVETALRPNPSTDQTWQQIQTSLNQMGLPYREDRSRKSASRYLEVEVDPKANDGNGEWLKIRVSDHHLPDKYLNDADFFVGNEIEGTAEFVGGYAAHWTTAVKQIAVKSGKPIPANTKSVLTRFSKDDSLAAARQAARGIQSRSESLRLAEMRLRAFEKGSEFLPEKAKQLADIEHRINEQIQDPYFGARNAVSGKERKNLKHKAAELRRQIEDAGGFNPSTTENSK
jgi:hypothetical protein